MYTFYLYVENSISDSRAAIVGERPGPQGGHYELIEQYQCDLSAGWWL